MIGAFNDLGVDLDRIIPAPIYLVAETGCNGVYKKERRKR